VGRHQDRRISSLSLGPKTRGKVPTAKAKVARPHVEACTLSLWLVGGCYFSDTGSPCVRRPLNPK
jgi:hypothetical protein